MGGNLEKGVILLAFLLVILPTAAAQQISNPNPAIEACNFNGGIWCGALASGSCIAKGTAADPQSTIDCTISESPQRVLSQTVQDTSPAYYNFRTMIIQQDKILRFVSQPANMPFPSIPNMQLRQLAGGQGINPLSRTASNPCDGRWGGAGGTGGGTLQAGSSGLPGVCTGNSYINMGGLLGNAGGYVTLTVHDLNLVGTLSVSGVNAVYGFDAVDADSCGCPGGGGGGGGGAGILIISTSNQITGTGHITANGGMGGYPGVPTDDNGDFCGSGNDWGGGGGPGGGGAAGYIIVGSQFIDEDRLETEPGLGGGMEQRGTPVTRNNYMCIDVLYTARAPSGEGNSFSLGAEDCNDVIDNDLDRQTDMDDTDCRITQAQAATPPWDTSLWTIFKSGSYGYNESALSGADASCGDDLSNCIKQSGVTNPCTSFTTEPACMNAILNGGLLGVCVWGAYPTSNDPNICHLSNPNAWTQNTNACSVSTQQQCNARSGYCTWRAGALDVGYVSNNQQYACFDSWYTPTSGSGFWRRPGDGFKWYNSEENSDYRILAVNRSGAQTHFVSNGNDWFYCDATGTSTFGATNRLPEGGTFSMEFGDGRERCSNRLASLTMDDEPIRVASCTAAQKSDCEIPGALPAGANAYCWEPSGHRSYQTGTFIQQCNAYCSVRVGNSWRSLQNYLTQEQNVWCEELGRYEVAMCQNNIFNPGNPSTPPQSGGISSTLCPGVDVSICLGSNIDPLQSCQQNILSNGWQYSSTRICARPTPTQSGQFCRNGFVVHTSNDVAGEPVCCYGEDAYCADFSDAFCAEAHGTLRPNIQNNQGLVCVGTSLSNNCCLGVWSGDPIQVAQYPDVNRTFMCYKQNSNNLLVECCGSGSCYNGQEENSLNDYNDAPTKVYALAGVPLHTLMTFDEGTESKYMRFLNWPNSNEIAFEYPGDYKMKSWAQFQILEFDIAFNTLAFERMAIFDGTSTVTYNLTAALTSGRRLGRWVHVAIDLRQGAPPSFNWNNVVKMSFPTSTNTGSSGVMFNNFFLRSTSSTDGNSDNYYCTGDWGLWIKNLDGTADTGFYTGNPTLLQYGPYQYACDANRPFGWTGKACCGDDTRRGQLGEYWIDSQGACWSGTPVLNDDTVSNAVGVQSQIRDVELKQKSLLFYNGEMFSCDIDVSRYTERFSFDGMNQYLGVTFASSGKVTRAAAFSVKGSWICESGVGWVKKSDINRVRFLAGTLKRYAGTVSPDEHTLVCADIVNISNFVGTLNQQELALTNYACALKLGRNNDRLFLGLEVRDVNTPFEAYRNKTLEYFNPLAGIMDSNIDCSQAAPEPSSSEFFRWCGEYNGFHIYYNRPFNLVILASGRMAGPGYDNGNNFVGLMADFWSGIIGFFRNLFGGTGNLDLPSDLATNPKIRDFYLSVNEYSNGRFKQVFGIMQTQSGQRHIKVNYENLNTNVRLLRDATAYNYPRMTVSYASSGYNQTIYVNGSVGSNVDWKLFTSLLRLGPDGAPVNFPPVAPPPDIPTY